MDKPNYPFTLFDNLLREMFKRMPLRHGAILHFSPRAEKVRDEMFAWVAGRPRSMSTAIRSSPCISQNTKACFYAIAASFTSSNSIATPMPG